jgi:sulfur-carrier protein
MQILLFGQLADIAGSPLSMDGVTDTDRLIKELLVKHPALADLKYVIAVDKKVITSNQNLDENSVVALLPPFSGG